MKRSKIIIIVLIVILIICCILLGWIMSFKEEDASLDNELFKVSCDTSSLKKNNEVICKLRASVKDYKVSAISATIEESTNYKLIEVIPDKSWEGDGENGDIDLYTDVNKSGDFNIASFKISLTDKNIDDIEIFIKDNSFFDQDFLEHKVADVSKKVSIEK